MKYTDQEWRTLSQLLDEALALAPAERQAWLETLPRWAEGLRPTLRALLSGEASAETDAFLDTLPKIGASSARNDGTRLREGAIVGAYRLLRPLGRGGMGSVWLAERTDGLVKRPVALKLPHAGEFGAHLAERFARERDILAALTHPHIARLYDAGTTADGQPYLALEYVDGEPLGKYCDARRLDLPRRLALFAQVLDAVQYAHARLVVHRDLKPSNILVENDEVHLLDFGIARLVADEPLEQSDLTQAAGPLLTLDYASPEQVAGVALTIATDVYSLGVILYELATGERPYRVRRASRSALEEAILDGEIVRPSAACKDRAKAALRDTSIAKLQKALSGDLDTIILKALKKSPAERYASVTALADDLRRCARSEPISARADSLVYRASKFVRRHASGVSAALATTLAAVVLVGYYTAQLTVERDRARLEAQKATKVSELLGDLLTGADPFAVHEVKEPTVRDLLDAGAARVQKELDGEPELQAEMLTVIGRVYQRLGASDKAQPILERALAVGRSVKGGENERVARTLNDLGVLLRERGDFAAATPMLEESLAMRRRLLGNEHKDVAVTLVELARAYRDQGLDARAEPLLRESLAIRRKVLGEDDHETGVSKGDLALLLWTRGDLAEAEPLFRQSLETFRKTRGPAHPDVGTALNNLSLIVADKGDYAQAESLLRESLRIGRASLGPKHPNLAPRLNNLANVLREEGKREEALAAIREALEVAAPHLEASHPRLAGYKVTLARLDLAGGDAPAAESLLRDALSIREHAYPEGDWRIGEVKGLLGQTLTSLGRYEEAESLLLDAARVLQDRPGLQGREARAMRSRLAGLYDAWGRPEKAAEYRGAPVSDRHPPEPSPVKTAARAS